MISKWKYNYSDEEKNMALTIQNQKQEIDKLVDTIEDVNREFSQYKYESKKEIEKLNNIINELEKYINKTKLEEFEKEYGRRYAKTFTQAEVIICNMILNKLHELKGSDKE